VQGASGTTLPSFAGLFDLGGSDLYRVQGSSGTNDVEIHAQGYADGLSAPIGGLVDAGQGDDSYSIDAGTGVGATAGPDAWTQHFAAGQGMGSLGTGVLSDGGGKDSFSLVAHGEWTTTDGYPLLSGNEPLTQLPLSETIGQGAGGIGTGMLLEGPGDTTYTAEDTSTGIAYNSVSVQGSGGIGLGVLDDPSGDDTYSATASLTYDHPVTVDDSCTQTDEITGATVPCPSAKTFVHGYNTANFAQLLYAQGFGYLGGQGLLLDAAGNDTYRSTVAATLHTSLHDAMTAPSDRAWFDVWGYGVQWNIGQGVAQGEGSDALLLDAAGNDTYASHSSTETVAIATSDHAPGTPRVTALAPYRDGVWTQGVGYGISGTGALLDLGGTGDRFDVSSTDTMATSPDTGGDLRASLGWPLAQGAAAGGNATGLFEALGQSPMLSLSPRRGVCPQSPPRGFGGWVDCAVFGDDPDHQPIDYRAVTPAAGFAPFSTGQPTALAFTGDTSSGTAVGHRVFGDDDGATVAVGATLTGPDGKPLAGRLVHFDLQALLKAEDVFYKAWFTTWEVDAVTDADGVARAVLPIDDLSAWGFTYADYDYRLLATFDGAAALYPVHTAKAFQLSA
jgi:hypothetical protein